MNQIENNPIAKFPIIAIDQMHSLTEFLSFEVTNYPQKALEEDQS